MFSPFLIHQVSSTARVGIIGFGGLGHMGLQFANKWGCEVHAFTTSDSKEAEACQLGAHVVHNTKQDGVDKSIAGSLDLILSTINAPLDSTSVRVTRSLPLSRHFRCQRSTMRWNISARVKPVIASALPMSASNVNPEQESVTPSGRKPTVAPRPMSKNEIRQTVADFGIAAKNALEAGFDGVQIQANYLYLIAQFLNSATNLRKDEYGGSTVNPARFLFEITETILQHVEPERVGIKIGPMNIPSLTPGYRPRDGIKVGSVKISGPFAANADTLPDMEYVIKRLNDYNLAHLLFLVARLYSAQCTHSAWSRRPLQSY